MKTQQKPIMTLKNYGITLLIVGLTGCAHQPPFNSSAGHIGSEQDNQQKVSPAGDIPKPVKKLAYVPPPKPKVKEPTYSVVVSDVPVREILFALARESKLNIDVHPAIEGKVTLNAVDQTLPAILDRLGKQLDLRYKVENNVIFIGPDLPVFRTYKVNYVNMERDTTSSIGVAAQIGSTSTSALDSGGGSSSGGGGQNSSTTTVKSTSKNNFWALLEDNIKVILKSTKSQTTNLEEKAAKADALRVAQEERLKQVEAVSKAGAGAEKLFQEAFKSQSLNLDSKDEVIINPVAGTITVMATERQHGFIQQYLDTLTQSVQRQVLIEATIVEVKLSNDFQAGIDWSRISSGQGLTFKQTLGGVAGVSGPQLVASVANPNSFLGNISASVRLLQTFGTTKVLSSPKLMALNNQTAILKVVDNLVYFTVDVETNTTQGVQKTTYTSNVHTVPVGVVMSVTPQVGDNENVTLTVRPTISRKVDEIEDPNPDLGGVKNFIPVIQAREMESVLQIPSGSTAILGGLMQDDVTKTTDTVPGVASLPLVGKVFQGRDNTVTKTELVIFLRPTVVRNSSIESDELRSFKQYLPENKFPASTDDVLNEPAN